MNDDDRAGGGDQDDDDDGDGGDDDDDGAEIFSKFDFGSTPSISSKNRRNRSYPRDFSAV